MGKKRIATVGEKPKKERKIVKTGKEHGRITDVGEQALKEAAEIEQKAKKLEAEIAAKKQKTTTKEKTAQKKERARGKQYQQARKKVDRNKSYPLSEAIKLLKSVSFSHFNGSVDVHLVLRKGDIKGEVEFPHPTGKKQNIRLADDQLIKELEKGKIDFTLLLATPAMMPKLTKYAKILGPRGLMPNPKAGTITEEPEKVIKKMASKTILKTEIKAPLMHISIGKVDYPEKHLEENFQALIEAVGRHQIAKAVIAASMSPGIKVQLTNLTKKP